MHSSDLLNVAACVAGGPLADQAEAAFPCLASLGPAGGSAAAEALAGSAYRRAKRELAHQEQLVLRAIRFDVTVDQPHRYLLNFCKGLRSAAQVTQLAVCLLNDGVCATTLDSAVPAACLAAGCLAAACRLLPDTHRLPDAWQASLGLDQAQVAAAGQRLLAALTASA